MQKRLSLLFVGLIIPCLLNISQLHSQEISDPESEYMRIRTMAFSGEHTEAVTAAWKLLKAYPSYGDVRVLLARILAWQKDFHQATAVIDTLLLEDPDNGDALEVKRDISLWSKENTAVETDVRAGYSFDFYTEPYTRFWQVLSAGAGHRFGWGPAAASINTGFLHAEGDEVINATEFQIEAEAYPRISDKNYAYLNYAFSPGNYFPTHRGAVEIWQVLPNGFAVSGGMNYYYFDRNIFIALASVEKYAGKFWFSGKWFIYFKDDGPRASFYVNARRYFNDFNYLQLTLGTGTAPDEPYAIREDINRLSANSIRLLYNFNAGGRLTVKVGAGYSREEYDLEGGTDMRNRFEGVVNLVYAIKMK